MVELGIIAVIYLGVILWILINGGHYLTKAAVIATLPALVLVTWFSVDSYRGWPIPVNHMPKQSIFVAGVVDEPDPAIHDLGYIDVWLVMPPSHTLLGHKTVYGEPRAYHLPYSRLLHQAVNQAQKIQKDGGGSPIIQAETVIGGRGNKAGGEHTHYVVYRNPPPTPPQKGQP